MSTVAKRSLLFNAQTGWSIVIVIAISSICFLLKDIVGYRSVALILMMVVSTLAMLFDIIPVLIACVLSAFIWNFLFIPPQFTFQIQSVEDLLFFSMYFIIALVNAVLTSRIRDRNKKIRAKEEKEKALALHNTILNSLSHEFRTPIATILGSLDAMQQSDSLLTEKQQASLYHEMNEATLRLNRLVENMLNVSRLEAGTIHLHLDWVDMNELIYRAIQKFQLSFPTYHFMFTPNETAPLYKVDSVLIEQVFSNLFQNAIQYTPPGTTIQVEHQFQNDMCKLTVSDNGKGLSHKELISAFEKFYRVPGSKPFGFGLGLSIVKGFVEAHNGTVSVVNQDSGGARFVITLPAETSFIKNLKNE